MKNEKLKMKNKKNGKRKVKTEILTIKIKRK
jgi:hypothetical protein